MENTVNGFEAIFDAINNNIGKEDKIDPSKLGESSEELTDEELEALKGGKRIEEEEEEEEQEEEEKEPAKKSKKVADIKEEAEETEEEGEESDDTESSLVVGLFDSIAEEIGWQMDEADVKPKTVEELVKHFKDVIEENSVPVYANDNVAKLDEFVKNGGNIRDYFTIDAEIDLEKLDIEDEYNQKLVVKELLKEKGFSEKQIEKKINKYEEAGLLEDEAEDAIEALGEIRIAKKEQLLANQQKAAIQAKKEQQEFFSNVVSEIKGMKDIRGIAIPEKDKQFLVDYIFKQDADGRSKYQKDYAKSLKNLLESAYFTMKGDTLLSVAKSEGKKDAITSFKNSLKSNSGVSTKSKKEIKTSDDSLWSSFTRQLRVA